MKEPLTYIDRKEFITLAESLSFTKMYWSSSIKNGTYPKTFTLEESRERLNDVRELLVKIDRILSFHPISKED